ncbi:hypothetical protein [Cellulosilyticum sp. WCF-2]|uniref:hypothetical protein n=1 Tax=Cellulosilyticum sp. WCF-2 TaxID=2497860 RepID=UPI000F8EB068|nr:hypothetical protein [Cellulosilyticum sp. WCF-2]QEH69358.1 hypothetical protein EKH84_13520 [Cellulosilyticum sp. WCF-2]
MSMQDFDMGFLSTLMSFGISNGESSGGLPDMSTLLFVNCAYYSGDLGEGSNYLYADSYVPIFSSGFSYIPKKGGIVMMGSYQLEDPDDYSGETPMAMLKITVDDKVIFEDDITAYFPDPIVEKVRGFSYQNSFKIEAKRLNLTDSMGLQLYQTMIIGYK